jgi:hypothetical protein
MKKLTVEDVKQYAWDNYNKGGDVIIECWTDDDIQERLDEGYTLGDFRNLMDVWEEEDKAARYFSGMDEKAEEPEKPAVDCNRKCSNCMKRAFAGWCGVDYCMGYELCCSEQEEIDTANGCDNYEFGTPACFDCDDDCPSATAGDYSPSAPWNAPGMSIHDFI